MNCRVLLVEDDTNMREIIGRALTKAGYQVSQAIDGQTAIDLLTHPDTAEEPFEVVISDIVMGDIDGIEVMDVARQQPYTPEVILLTGYAALDTAIAAVRSGAFDYLQKPCRIATLLERTQQAAEHHRARVRQTEESVALRRVVDILAHVHQSAPATPDPTTPEAAWLDAIPAALADASTNGTPEDADPQHRYHTVGQLSVDTYRHEVWFDDTAVHVTPTEYALLAFLSGRPGRVAEYSEIVGHTHGNNIDTAEAHELLRWHVRNLRRKFDRRYLVSVRGVGYMLTNPDDGTTSSTN
jgi:DNA-binding response OmpR family regulator